ncbi:MAG: carbohydrate kinase family protein [Terriglobales bacterium]|jgi:sugar/nucleoside kinase (ribokinase family)
MPRFDVTIAGELNLDLIMYGFPESLPPERELLANDMSLTLGSSSAIVAHNMAALGSKVGFTSCVGNDDFGKVALSRLQAIGVDVSTVVKLPDEKTGVTVILPREKWRNILTYPGTIAMLAQHHLDFEFLSSARHFHLSSYFLQIALQPFIPDLLKRLKVAGLTISLDTNDDPADEWQSGAEQVLSLVDVFLPNQREAQKITHSFSLGEALDKLTKLVPLVVVKLGSGGAIACRAAERLSSPAIQTQSFDSVGAGDSFDAGFLRAFVRGEDLETCLENGNLAGALSVTRPGGTEAFRDAPHRENFLSQHRERSIRQAK